MNASMTQSFPTTLPLTLPHRQGKPLNFSVHFEEDKSYSNYNA